MISAKVKRKQLIKKYPEKLKTVNRQFLPIAGNVVEGGAKLLINNVTGNLAASIKSRVDGDMAIVGTNLEYAPHVEYGTRPHQITVNGPVFLESKKSGTIGWRYLKTINHPGTKAQPFLRTSLDNNRKKLLALYRKIFRSVYRG